MLAVASALLHNLETFVILSYLTLCKKVNKHIIYISLCNAKGASHDRKCNLIKMILFYF